MREKEGKRRMFGWKIFGAHVEISKRDLFEPRTRKNGIGFFSRGGRVSKTCPFPDLRRFMENSCPLFRPLSVNNPPMMHLSSKLSMEFPSKLLSNLVQAALSFPSSPSPFFVSIYPHADTGCSFDVSSIICSAAG